MRRCYSQLNSPDAEKFLKKFKDHAEMLHDEFSAEKRNAAFVSGICAGLKISTETIKEELLEFE